MSALGDILNPGTSVTTINPAVIEAGAKIAACAMDAGFQSWGTYFKRGIVFRPGSSAYLPPREYLEGIKEPLLVTTVKWNGDRDGRFHIAIPESLAKGTIALFLTVMVGAETSPDTVKIDAEGLDTYNELASSLVQQGAQKARGEIKGKIEWVTEGNRLVPPGEEIAGALGTEELVCCAGTLTIEGLAPVTVHMMMTVPCTGLSAALPETAAAPEAAAPAGGLSAQTAAAAPARHRNEHLVMKLPLPINVTLAVTKKRVESVQELAPGSIIEFRKLSGEFLDINAGNTKIAEGEVVIISQHFGIQVRNICPQIPFAHMLRH